MQQLAKETAVMVAPFKNQSNAVSAPPPVSPGSGHLMVDADGTITAVDDTAVALLGRPRATLLGRSWPVPNLELLPLTAVATPMPSAADSGARLLTLSPAPNARPLDEALSLTQRLAGIGLLTASVTHEINNPISIITTACGNLQHELAEQQLSEETLKRYLDMIESSAWRCARILNVLRQYSHEDEPQSAVTDLNMIVHDALVLLQHQFRLQYHVDIIVDLNENLRSIVCDHNRITQVLINLLTNARDAMPDGGAITIKTDLLPAFFGDGADGMMIAVHDEGAGLPADAIDHIFAPFYTTKLNAAGLGLFVAKKLVEDHNGRLWAANKLGGGAVFTMVLPPHQ